MRVSVGLLEDTSAANTFISVILVMVVLILASTTWIFLLDYDTPSSTAPNAVIDTELGKEALFLRHTGGDTIGPSDTDYISITGNENITIDWNDNVTNSTARSSKREAVVTDSITSGTEVAVVTNASTENSLRFVWFAVDGTGYTLLSDITPPGVGVDSGEDSVEGSLVEQSRQGERSAVPRVSICSGDCSHSPSVIGSFSCAVRHHTRHRPLASM